ncbi:MAG: type VI secretion system membrane subunit TssM [Gemmatimonadota bacterium]
MTRTKISLASAGTLLAFLGLAGAADALLGLGERSRMVLWLGLGVLGAAAAVLVWLLMAPRRAAPPADAEQGELAEVDATLAAAQARLAEAGLAETSRLGKLPVVLVLGPGGSTKTTTLVHSGLEPELLAGEVERNGATVPTAGVNLWYAQGTVFLEAGGRVVDEPRRWDRVVRRMQPDRLAAAFARGAQAPRVAVVCFGCDELLKPGSAEGVPAAARRLRARLAEVSQRLGIRLPVYVLFTKADRLPYFDDYVRSFSRDEAQEVLGATLPASPPPSVGLYAEHESERVASAFRQIVRSLALRRVEVLPREAREEVRTGAYEFPRELRKVTDLATQFLVELCKPSQLGVSPFLRGFYFSGVRTVVVSDAPAALQPPAAPVQQVSLGATSVFSAAPLRPAASPLPAPAAGGFGSREVPEWLFLKRLFREVILQDHAAMRVTGGGTRVNLLRRGLAGASAAAAAVLAVGMTVSFVQNRGLVRDALAAAEGVETLSAAGAEPPTADALRRLDALRARTEEVGAYEREGRPWRLGWGLYTGSRMHPELRRLYFDRFDRLLWGATRADLLASLDGLPDAPSGTAEYGSAYAGLKAHLVTTSHPRESTPAFLTPVLADRWSAAHPTDPERVELARRQFDFFARELPHGNPYREPPREATVARTRSYLGRFAGAERFYQAMLGEASREAGGNVEFNRSFPGSEAVLRNDYVVPGAFTREGWAFVQENRDAADRLFGGEEWVLGSRAVSPVDRDRLARELRSRYAADYVRHWQAFLEAGTPAGFGGLGDAAGKVGRMAANDSPLLQMLAVASRHTAVDSVQVGRVFQPVHSVVRPDSADRPAGGPNAQYMQALAGLHSSLKRAAGAPPVARQQALDEASRSVAQVEGEARLLAQGFRIEGEAGRVGAAVQRLLLAPASALGSVNAATAALPDPEAEAKAAAATAINQQGAAFCRAYGRLAGRYPFNRRAAAEARMEEVSAVFQKEGSALRNLYEGALQPLLVRQGSGYTARAGAQPAPAPAFVSFFSRASDVSDALYAGGSGPELAFTLRPQTSAEIPEITVAMDGQRVTFTRTSAADRAFRWNGSRAQGMRVTGKVNGAEVTLLEAQGPWAVFRLFGRADWSAMDDGRWAARWRLAQPAMTLTTEVTFAEGIPLLDPDYLGRLGCVSRIVR